MTTYVDRRRLLKLSGLTLAGAAIPLWIEQAFAQGVAGRVEPPKSRADALLEAWTASRERGKPLLVFVVPRFHDRNERGRALAAYLERASSAALADLALCETTCAMLEELRALLPGIEARFEGEPLAVLVECDGKSAKVAVESSPRLPTLPDGYGPEIAAQSLGRLHRWAEILAEEFHAAIAGGAAVLARRADEARAHLATADRERLSSLVANAGRWDARDILTCPAWAMHAATTYAARESCILELARHARSTLVERSPRGARWAQPAPCGGTQIEDPREYTLSPGPCGTGSTTSMTRRFLWFYSKSER